MLCKLSDHSCMSVPEREEILFSVCAPFNAASSQVHRGSSDLVVSRASPLMMPEKYFAKEEKLESEVCLSSLHAHMYGRGTEDSIDE